MSTASVVIFDCDGVMFDSRAANVAYYTHILAHFGLPPVRDEDIQYVHTATGRESVRHIFRHTSLGDEAEAYRLIMDYRPFVNALVMEPGLTDLLRALKSRCALAVATNRSLTIREVLTRFELAPWFDMVVSSQDVTAPKPDPECLLKILSHLGKDPADAFYVGDARVDSDTAAAAGVPFIAYKDPSLPALHHVDRLPDILPIVAG